MTDKPLNPVAGESLSALMDGEATDFELQRVLREALQDDSIRAAWSRYQLVSSIIQQQPCHPVASPGFADRVLSALQDDAKTSVPSVWHKPMARFAVAASVAVAVVAGVQWRHGDLSGSEQVVAEASKAPPVVEMMPVASPLFASQSTGKPSAILPARQAVSDMQYPVNFVLGSDRHSRAVVVPARADRAGQ
jgi:sigma-E factor negative regulatory protein RseA